MKYYAVAEIDITDQNWVRDYVKNVTRPSNGPAAATWLAHRGSKQSHRHQG